MTTQSKSVVLSAEVFEQVRSVLQTAEDFGSMNEVAVSAIAALEAAPVVQDVNAGLVRVLEAVQAYLPPDGISKDDFISRVITCVDPWPIAAAEAARPVCNCTLRAALQPFLEALDVIDSDSMGSLSLDNQILFWGSGSWSPTKNVTLGDLRNLGKAAHGIGGQHD